MVFFLAVLVMALSVAYLYERHQSERSQSSTDAPEEDKVASVLEADREGLVLYAEALKAVREDYVDQEAIDSKEQAYGAIKGMLDSLGDKEHTRFLSPEEVQKTREALSSKRVETGLRLEDRGDEVVVLTLLDGSPAEEAGIEPGDVLIAVDDRSVRGENILQITERLKGPEGSRMDLAVLRDEEELGFSLERVELKVPAASWNLISGTDVAHLRLTLFSENSAAELEEAAAEAREAGARRFVMDLRDNRGGKLDQAEKTAAQFLSAGTVVYIRKDIEGNEQETTVPDDNEPIDIPLVTLVNGGSASSSEIVAGALRDNGRAKVVGETTLGTGTVLDNFVLSDGSAILLGVAEWLTPNGDPIRGFGIVPDVSAGLEESQKLRAPDEVRGLSREEIFAEDAQLERAFAILYEG
jgi:carboxyl-terminal processing protease